MAGTRRSARQAGTESSPPSAKSTNGTKRKAEESSPATASKSKRGRPSKAAKEQKTLEETMPATDDTEEQQDVEMSQPANESDVKDDGNSEFKRADGCWGWHDKANYEAPKANGQGEHGKEAIVNAGDSFKGKNKEGESMDDPEKALKDSRGGAGVNALDEVKADEGDSGKTDKGDDNKDAAQATNGAQESAIEEDKEREKAQPSNVMEKGIIYFFTRGRVDTEHPQQVQDLQRSFMVLRPLPPGGKLTDGVIQDVGNNRLIAVPKKVWPKSGKDKFMAFVEKAGVSMETLKEEFFQGSTYSTQTVGTRHTPDVTPIGEGVYAITYTGSGRTTNHLSYMLTIPQEIGQVQEDVGIAEKGSFVLSAKNPNAKQPSYAALPQSAEFPKELLDEFGSLGWLPARPEHLNYANAQVLLIGEDFNGEGTDKDEKDESKETPVEELEKLEHEDELRIQHLKGDDTVYLDLGISAKDYPSVKTTW
ncbi:hypothetical protein B0A54_15944 [Friedmanniomyces endolithicus]|uniref:BTB domain transcription factor n=1 Tax=Friedmanniomyces endolithicus TaxID=329885 RepID=A0A4U0U3G1_9PEZI|nr:hypothetical protein LTS09_015359 [Friedmanniomyces endolithicus]TKA29344.1 hypothetical protein B0A54_15944 [Friedmanniomyces endolithicus]